MISLIYKIPFKTPTINHLYGRHSRGFMFVKKEALELKKEIEEIVWNANVRIPDNIKLSVEVSIYENWLTKKGDVKKKDIANREKFLIDSVFGALEIDDKMIWEHSMKKVQSKEEFAVVKIKEFRNE